MGDCLQLEATEPEDEGDRVLCVDKDEPEPERFRPGNHDGVTGAAACFSRAGVTSDRERRAFAGYCAFIIF